VLRAMNAGRVPRTCENAVKRWMAIAVVVSCGSPGEGVPSQAEDEGGPGPSAQDAGGPADGQDGQGDAPLGDTGGDRDAGISDAATEADASDAAPPSTCPYPALRALGLPHDGVAGSLAAGPGRFVGTTCGGGAGFEDIYSLHVAARTGIILRDTMFMGTPGLSFSIRRSCDDAPTELACGSFASAGFLRVALDPGDYFVVVDSDSALTYSVALDAFTAAPNATCASATPLVPAAPLTGQDLAAGGGSGTKLLCTEPRWLPRLYYSVTVPPSGSATVTGTATSQGFWPLLQVVDGCATASCLASSDGDGGASNSVLVTNGTAAPRDVIVAVALGQGTPPSPRVFDISVQY
jgi:hypothetical protein